MYRTQSRKTGEMRFEEDTSAYPIILVLACMQQFTSSCPFVFGSATANPILTSSPPFSPRVPSSLFRFPHRRPQPVPFLISRPMKYLTQLALSLAQAQVQAQAQAQAQGTHHVVQFSPFTHTPLRPSNARNYHLLGGF
ncbi:hypothetical protein B0T10DRAFT_460782 [Thelonectria olida]|uniref:Uncharacterized protein n=1 Tax=Thelonectria olida TaxID=1576542 RepID=A0A9P9AP90_9HYPO|nr:hypothetical protein B0T10DRAFT_460782 [Thelonectria olida]